MRAVFINVREIVEPDYFTMYHHANGYHYQRIESEIDAGSFDKDCSCVKIELYRNSTGAKVRPVLVSVIFRQE